MWLHLGAMDEMTCLFAGVENVDQAWHYYCQPRARYDVTYPRILGRKVVQSNNATTPHSK